MIWAREPRAGALAGDVWVAMTLEKKKRERLGRGRRIVDALRPATLQS